MKNRFAVAFAAGLLAAGTVLAIDRDARMIDAFGIEGHMYDNVDVMAFGLSSEIGLETLHRDWSVLAALFFGQSSPDRGADGDAWGGSLGVKYYLTDLTSASLFGSFTTWDAPASTDILEGTLRLKHRFIPADEVISPYVTAGAALGDVSVDKDIGRGDSTLTQLTLMVGAGCEFMMADDMALRMEGSLLQSEKLSGEGDDFEDGWTAGAALVYYWE